MKLAIISPSSFLHQFFSLISPHLISFSPHNTYFYKPEPSSMNNFSEVIYHRTNGRRPLYSQPRSRRSQPIMISQVQNQKFQSPVAPVLNPNPVPVVTIPDPVASQPQMSPVDTESSRSYNLVIPDNGSLPQMILTGSAPVSVPTILGSAQPIAIVVPKNPFLGSSMIGRIHNQNGSCGSCGRK